MQVVSSISAEDQETLFEGIEVKCHNCSKDKEISAFTHRTCMEVDAILQCRAFELFQGVEPVFDVTLYRADTFHEVAKHCVFPMFCKVGSLKRRVRR